jgi:hypothetical protein
MMCGGQSGGAVAATVRPKRGSRLRAWLRALLAGPCTAGLTVLVFAAMPYWVPKGAGGVDHIAFPLFFMPAIWGVIFFYALLDRSLARIAIMMSIVAVIHLIVLREHLLGSG